MNKGKDAPVVIVGAGVCGLTLGCSLLSRGRGVILLEREERVGGLARSFRYGNHIFDIGPHRFHTENREVVDFIKSILDEEMFFIKRKSSVFFSKRYYRWPIHPGNLLHFPKVMAFRILLDLFTNIFRKREVRNFKDYILNQYGTTLYRNFFLDYTMKFINLHPVDTHTDWAMVGINRAIIDDRLKMRNLYELIRTTLFKPKGDETHFVYPKRGMQSFCDMAAGKIEGMGGRIYRGVERVDLKLGEDAVELVDWGVGSARPSWLVWTGPVNELSMILGLPDPGLTYLSIILYNVEITRVPDHDFQWCYFGDQDIIFNRVTKNTAFSPHMAPPERCGLCLEVTCREGDEVWTRPETLMNRIMADLKKVYLISSAGDVADIHIERVRNAYPIYDTLYRERLDRYMASVKGWKNLLLGGRTGLFWYNNMDHSMENALYMTRFITEGEENAGEFNRWFVK